MQNKLDIVQTKAILSDLFIRTEDLHSGIHYKSLALSGKNLKLCELDKEPILSSSITDGLKMVY